MTDAAQRSAHEYYCEPRYDMDYRFRLWVAAVDDLDMIGGGYRGYTDQIKRCFEDWRRKGYRIHNHKGAPINETVLFADDVYGFLGLNRATPSGPGRQISHDKFSILDMYFKIKHPGIARLFPSDGRLIAMIEGVQSFLTHPDRPVIKFLHHKLQKTSSGIYTPNPMDIQRLANDYKSSSASDFDFYVPMYSVLKTDEFPFCIIRRISIPILRFKDIWKFDLNPEFETAASVFAAQDVRIYSGVGFPAMDPQRRQVFSLHCILRDRTTYSPYFSNISFNHHSLNLEAPSNLASPSNFRENYFEKSYSEFYPLFRVGEPVNSTAEQYLRNTDIRDYIDDIVNSLGLEI